MGGLAKGMALAYPTTSAMVDALERKGLVQRQALESDRRTISLHLTPEGETLSGNLENLLDELEQAIQSLPQAQQEALNQAARQIVYRLNAAGYIHLHEMCWHCQFFRQNAHPNDPHRPHHCAFMDAPLAEADTYLDCPDFHPVTERR